MDVVGKVAVVTGAGAGIGAAIAHRMAAAGARVIIADLQAASAQAVASAINAEFVGAAVAVGADVADRDAISGVLDLAEHEYGSVDIYFANAGVTGGAEFVSDDHIWAQAWDVNVLAHVHAAQLLVPQWVERGSGYFVATGSAASLLTQIGSATYSVTKHAALAFAEWLSVTYGDRGVRVSCICPMGVNTALLHEGFDSDHGQGSTVTAAVAGAGAVLEPDDVAASVVAALAEEPFLILPHPEVLGMFQRKANDYDRWLRGMRRYQLSLAGTNT